MKVPRNVTGRQLISALRTLGYEEVRQRGSHVHVVTEVRGKHHIVVPEHRPLKAGTLNHLLKDVAVHHGISRDELIEKLGI